MNSLRDLLGNCYWSATHLISLSSTAGCAERQQACLYEAWEITLLCDQLEFFGGCTYLDKTQQSSNKLWSCRGFGYRPASKLWRDQTSALLRRNVVENHRTRDIIYENQGQFLGWKSNMITTWMTGQNIELTDVSPYRRVLRPRRSNVVLWGAKSQRCKDRFYSSDKTPRWSYDTEVASRQKPSGGATPRKELHGPQSLGSPRFSCKSWIWGNLEICQTIFRQIWSKTAFQLYGTWWYLAWTATCRLKHRWGNTGSKCSRLVGSCDEPFLAVTTMSVQKIEREWVLYITRCCFPNVQPWVCRP